MVGTEFDWIGADSSGILGIFSTAGSGPVPPTALERCDDHSKIIQYIRETAGVPTWADLLTYVGEAPIYVYDWEPNLGPYLRTRVPQGAPALTIDSLPVAFTEVVERLNLDFSSSEPVLAESIIQYGEQDVTPNA